MRLPPGTLALAAAVNVVRRRDAGDDPPAAWGAGRRKPKDPSQFDWDGFRELYLELLHAHEDRRTTPDPPRVIS